jgi:hypothetical protein
MIKLKERTGENIFENFSRQKLKVNTLAKEILSLFKILIIDPKN